MNSRPEKNRKTGKGRKIVTGTLFAVFLAVFLFSGYKIASYYLESAEADESYSELREECPVPVSDAAPDADEPLDTAQEGQSEQDIETHPQRVVSMDFDALKKTAPDIVAWIRCEGTNIDYPVVQAADNTFYLKHLYNGRYNGGGSIFMDCRNTSVAEDDNLVLYGHHMKNNTMFGPLMGYKSQAYYEEHPTMMLYTPEGDYRVELLSGTIEDGSDEFVRFDFGNYEDKLDYVSELQKHSTFASDVDLVPGDRLISLCTCSYERNNVRYMVVGKLVPLFQL